MCVGRILIFIFLFWGTVQASESCFSFFSNQTLLIGDNYYSQTSKRNLSKVPGVIFRGFVKLKSIPEKVFIKIERPKLPVRKWAVLVHGLLDSHRGWNDIVPKLLEEGVGVVRLDMLGHGKTLYEQYKHTLDTSQDIKIPYQIPVEANIEVLIEVINLLTKYGINKPALIGHSMGSAIALAVSSVAPKDFIAPEVVLISPYVYRLERRALEKNFDLFGFGGFGFLFDLMPDFYREFFEKWMMDYFSDPLMYNNYVKFAESRVLEANSHLTPEQLNKVIKYHIRAAMAATKGLRNFDGINIAKILSRNPEHEQKYKVIVGEKDELLDLSLMKKFANSLPESVIEIQPQARHMIINQEPDFIVQSILDFILPKGITPDSTEVRD